MHQDVKLAMVVVVVWLRDRLDVEKEPENGNNGFRHFMKDRHRVSQAKYLFPSVELIMLKHPHYIKPGYFQNILL